MNLVFENFSSLFVLALGPFTARSSTLKLASCLDQLLDLYLLQHKPSIQKIKFNRICFSECSLTLRSDRWDTGPAADRPGRHGQCRSLCHSIQRKLLLGACRLRRWYVRPESFINLPGARSWRIQYQLWRRHHRSGRLVHRHCSDWRHFPPWGGNGGCVRRVLSCRRHHGSDGSWLLHQRKNQHRDRLPQFCRLADLCW